jgi:UDP-N-acetylglucosamine:LPS N-acetylglucosamine transferase
MVTLESLEMDFVDVLRSVDALITKPGYGTYTEAVCNGMPLLTLARPDWPETPYLNAWAQMHGRLAEITPDDFRRGAFATSLEELWSQSSPKAVPAPSGITQAADLLLEGW